ncbi:MAG: DNA internalization-related competence protein ComEC/Rec2 [Chloroflexota bacterium]|nr:DNA internalization-related competence protein ComEC/Rec2 [Chloroflexota bacterium]
MCIALAVQMVPLLGVGLAVILAVGFAILAVASADRARRLCWCAATLVAAISGLATLFGPLPGFDLRHAGPLDGLREALADPLRRLIPEPEGGIVRGIVLGERAAVDADLATAFARSGTSHLLAISGFNMTLVATAVALVARGRVRPAITASLTVSCVLAYSVLVGLAPSVARAAVMAVVASLGLAFGRRPATDNALALAVATMVGIDASAIGDVGFLLSATATGGLLYLGDPISRRLAFLPGAVRQGLATTFAATLPTIPIIAAVFGRVSLVSPVANLLAVPLFPPLMLAGAATAALGTVSVELAQIPALLAYSVAYLLRLVVETSAALPLASLAVPDGSLAGLAYGTAVALALFLGPVFTSRLARGGGGRIRWLSTSTVRSLAGRLLARRALWASGAVGIVLVIASIAAVLWPPASGVRVRALDVGQGDAFLVEFDGRTLLIDGGPDPTRLLAELGASLPPWTRRIDVIALTHAHADHADGLIGVLERYEVGLAIEPVGLNPGAVATAWSDRIARRHVARRALAAGMRVQIGATTLAVLAPNGDPRVDVPSLVLRVERGAFSMLFMGDATEQAQADLLLSPTSLAARVYVPPHHGAASAYAVPLVDAVRPSAAVISVGAKNRYGHPTPETLAALGRVPTYRTDRDGTVELHQGGNQLVVRTHANGLPAPRGGFLPHAPPAR